MKNSNDTIGNRTRDLPTCSAVIVVRSRQYFKTQEEENLGLPAKFDILEFMVIISRICMDRHSAAPNIPNFSSLPKPTLVCSHRSVETRLKVPLIPPNHISSLRILPSLYTIQI
jgi:hypothetical protein